MKRLAFALSLAAATAFAAPLAAQGPWYDPTGSGTRTGQPRNGGVYNDGGNNRGGVYNNIPTDGRWHRWGRDRNGNTIYVRERYDSQGNLVQEAATRNFLGQYRIIDRRVISYARNNRRQGRDGRWDRGDRDDRNGRWERGDRRGRNDRWDQNDGHDNGRHNGRYKNKNKDKHDDD